MTEVFLATCRKQPQLTPSDRILKDALEQRGVSVSAAPWDAMSPVDGLVCLRSTWDYHRRVDEFRAWLEALRVPVVNPRATVEWNIDKRYLRDLERRGIAIPVTRWFEPGIRPDLREVLAEEGWDRAVLKPRISATADGTHLVEGGTALAAGEWAQPLASGAMIQEFVPEIAAGELSLMYINGLFSHAVRKRPASGEFRVQQEFGGREELVEVRGDLAAFGRRALDASGREAVYARVDLVETPRGPVLMELELIEPEMFFYLAPAQAGWLADALLPGA